MNSRPIQVIWLCCPVPRQGSCHSAESFSRICWSSHQREHQTAFSELSKAGTFHPQEKRRNWGGRRGSNHRAEDEGAEKVGKGPSKVRTKGRAEGASETANNESPVVEVVEVEVEDKSGSRTRSRRNSLQADKEVIRDVSTP